MRNLEAHEAGLQSSRRNTTITRMVSLGTAEANSCSERQIQFFPPNKREISAEGLSPFLLGIQCGKPLASLGMRGVDSEKLGINSACAHRKLHGLEQLSELNVDRLPPWIEIDRLLEMFDGLIMILGYGPEAACQQGMVQSLFRRRFNAFVQPDDRANKVLRAQTFVSTLEPVFGGDPPTPNLLDGPRASAFDTSKESCEQIDIPDAAVRAFRDYKGTVHLIASRYVTRAGLRPSWEATKHNCQVVYKSPHDGNIADFDDATWLNAFYSIDGKRIVALGHMEYHGWEHPGMCAQNPDTATCW